MATIGLLPAMNGQGVIHSSLSSSGSPVLGYVGSGVDNIRGTINSGLATPDTNDVASGMVGRGVTIGNTAAAGLARTYGGDTGSPQYIQAANSARVHAMGDASLNMAGLKLSQGNKNAELELQRRSQLLSLAGLQSQVEQFRSSQQFARDQYNTEHQDALDQWDKEHPRLEVLKRGHTTANNGTPYYGVAESTPQYANTSGGGGGGGGGGRSNPVVWGPDNPTWNSIPGYGDANKGQTSGTGPRANPGNLPVVNRNLF